MNEKHKSWWQELSDYYRRITGDSECDLEGIYFWARSRDEISIKDGRVIINER